MKCTCGATVTDGAKFCPECGAKVETIVKSKCPACNSEQVGGKFCAACASPISPEANSAAEIDAAMSAIDTLAKSAGALSEDVTFTPSEATRAAIAAAPAGTKTGGVAPDGDGEGDESGEGMEMVKALLDAHNFLVDGQGTLGKEVRLSRKEIGTLAKSQVIVFGLLKSLTAKIDGIVNLPVGRRAVVNVGDRHTNGTPTGAGASGEKDPNDLGGLDLVAKATTCVGIKDGDGQPLLLAGEVARVEQWAHANGTMKSIVAQDAALGHRLERAFAELARRSH